MPAGRKAKITTGKSQKDGRYYNRLKSARGKTLLVSEGFKTKQAAKNNEHAVLDAALDIAGVLPRS